MKLAIVYDAVYPFVRGGAERRYHELALRLARSGHDVHWYCQRYWDGPRTWRKDGITYHGVCRARPLYTRRGRRSMLEALVFGLAALRMVAGRYDVVDCCAFPFFSTFAARLAVAVRGGRLVSTWHEFWGSDYWREYLGPLGGVGAVVERATARCSGRIIAVSATTATRLGAVVDGKPVVVLRNGVATTAFRAAGPQRVDTDVLYVGRLCDYKDVELLLAAVRTAARTRPSLSCSIVGDGPHRHHLEKLAAELGVAERVRFGGALPSSEEVYDAMQAARVLVLPSRREGFGIVVVEANAVGTPAIVVAHPDNSAVELIGGRNGLVAAPDAAELAAAIDRILAEPPGTRADAAREAAQRFSWDTIAEEYARVLEAAP